MPRLDDDEWTVQSWAERSNDRLAVRTLVLYQPTLLAGGPPAWHPRVGVRAFGTHSLLGTNLPSLKRLHSRLWFGTLVACPQLSSALSVWRFLPLSARGLELDRVPAPRATWSFLSSSFVAPWHHTLTHVSTSSPMRSWSQRARRVVSCLHVPSPKSSLFPLAVLLRRCTLFPGPPFLFAVLSCGPGLAPLPVIGRNLQDNVDLFVNKIILYCLNPTANCVGLV